MRNCGLVAVNFQGPATTKLLLVTLTNLNLLLTFWKFTNIKPRFFLLKVLTIRYMVLCTYPKAQISTIDLKKCIRLRVRVRHIQDKNYKKNKGRKTFLNLSFFKTLVTQNQNSSFNKGFYLRQEVDCSVRLLKTVMIRNSYDHKRFSKKM